MFDASRRAFLGTSFAGLHDTIDRNFRHVAENKNLPFNVHFDAGSSLIYQGQGSPYIIPAKYALGGNVVQEYGNLLCREHRSPSTVVLSKS